jgi:hypothetical protein
MAPENEFYSMDKIARKVCEDEMEKCIKGNRHETEIENLQKEIKDMKETNKIIFTKLDNINNKFLVIAAAAILQLLTVVGVLFAWVLDK